MCNLYDMTPKGEAERYLGSIGVDLEDYEATTVGPYQMGLFVKLVGRLGQWRMIRPDSSTSRPASRAVLTNNARIEDITKRITYLGALSKRTIEEAAALIKPTPAEVFDQTDTLLTDALLLRRTEERERKGKTAWGVCARG